MFARWIFALTLGTLASMRSVLITAVLATPLTSLQEHLEFFGGHD
jgi:hypothetical protein